MKERHERSLKEILDDRDMDFAIRDRFNSERHPVRTVDEDDENELVGQWDEDEGDWAWEWTP